MKTKRIKEILIILLLSLILILAACSQKSQKTNKINNTEEQIENTTVNQERFQKLDIAAESNTAFYYIDSYSNSIIEESKELKKRHTINLGNDIPENILIKDEWLYYINKIDNALKRYKLGSNNKIELITDIKCKEVYISKDTIITLDESNDLYIINYTNSKEEKLLNSNISSFIVDNKNIYFCLDNSIYKRNLNSLKEEVVIGQSKEKTMPILLAVHDDNLFYWSNGSIYKYIFKNASSFYLTDCINKILDCTIDEGSFYYTKNHNLFKLNLNSKKSEKILDNCSQIYINDNTIWCKYYTDTIPYFEQYIYDLINEEKTNINEKAKQNELNNEKYINLTKMNDYVSKNIKSKNKNEIMENIKSTLYQFTGNHGKFYQLHICDLDNDNINELIVIHAKMLDNEKNEKTMEIFKWNDNTITSSKISLEDYILEWLNDALIADVIEGGNKEIFLYGETDYPAFGLYEITNDEIIYKNIRLMGVTALVQGIDYYQDDEGYWIVAKQKEIEGIWNRSYYIWKKEKFELHEKCPESLKNSFEIVKSFDVWGVRKFTGDYIINLSYPNIKKLSEKYLAVACNNLENEGYYGDYYSVEDNVKYAIFDTKGKRLTDFKYYTIEYINDNTFFVNDEFFMYFIHSNGSIISKYPKVQGSGEVEIADGIITYKITRGIDSEVVITKLFDMQGYLLSENNIFYKYSDGIQINNNMFSKEYYNTICFPTIELEYKKDIEDLINFSIRAFFEVPVNNEKTDADVKKYADDYLKENRKNRYFSVGKIGNILEITRNDYTYNINKPTGYYFISNMHIDLETGNIYNLKDMLKKDINSTSVIQDILIKKINEQNIPCYKSAEGYIKNKKDFEFFLDYEGIDIIFNLYEIASYDEGIIHVKISYSEIMDIIDKNSEFYKLILKN